jgi:K+-transporting ATPase KdpF subunit
MNSYDNLVALIIGVLIVAYLVYALIFPEKL